MRVAASITFVRADVPRRPRSPASHLPQRLAADPKPDASIKNKNVEASVFLDDKIKADHGAGGGLPCRGQEVDRQECRGGRDLAQAGPASCFANGAWSFERKYDTRSVVDGRYVSIVRSDYMDTGGAHPNSDVDTILWDATEKKRIRSGRSSPRPPTTVRP